VDRSYSYPQSDKDFKMASVRVFRESEVSSIVVARPLGAKKMLTTGPGTEYPAPLLASSYSLKLRGVYAGRRARAG